MPSYAAVLGHQPNISLAELSAVLPDFTKKQIIENVAIFETAEELSQAFLDSLGGTILIARRITEAPVTLEDVSQLLCNETANVRKHVTFSLRAHGVPRGAVRSLFRTCKVAIRARGLAARYVGNEFKPAATALLRDSEILSGKRGCELVLLMKEETFWIGRTIAAQDIDAYTKRDMEKPVRDTTVGLLPPKLAQILLNFGAFLVRECHPSLPKQSSKLTPRYHSGQEAQSSKLTVLDPFCGTGVIPMEALRRGWPVLASDLSLKAVNGCTKNIEWLRKEEKIFKKDTDALIWKQDAAKPFELKELPDIVVTESSLGPALTDRPPMKEVAHLKSESERMQAAFLANASSSLPGIPLVCIWPAWRQRDGWVRLEKVWDVLGKLGYQAVLPPGIPSDHPRFPSLFYRRPDQYVGREIVLLKPRKK
ncbi:MAG: RsmD family RNA methyltransferase [Candidatus Peregrinibacteria bacterium]